jgi:phosphoglycerol transferase
MLVKHTLERGWYESTPRLGAPYGQEFHDFPMADNLHLLAAKASGVVVDQYSVFVNLYYLFGFVLAAWTALWVLRWLKVSPGPAAVAAVLFTFVPYHFLRGEVHFFLAAIYPIPLAAFLLLTALRGEPVLGDGAGWRRFASWRFARVVLSILIVGSASSYYALFTVFLLSVVGLVALFRERSWRGLAPAFVIAVAVVFVQVVNLAPDLLFTRSNGENLAVAKRAPEETEIYSLKLAQLVLPHEFHRIDSWASFRHRYMSRFPVPSEGGKIALGLVGAAGLLWLLAVPLLALARNGWTGLDRRHRDLSLLAVTAFLFATTGGVSSLLSLFGVSQLRGWNRMSVFLSFFALAAVAVLLDRLRERLRGRGAAAMAAVLLVVLGVGVFDQTSDAFVPDYAKLRNDFHSDREFVQRIEAALPEGAMVYQLPYVPFPEWPPVVKMIDYDHLRGYLHSEDLRWSYGGVKGRPTADWQTGLNQKGVRTVLRGVAAAGFAGLWVDRFGYGDGGLGVETEIRSVLGPEAFASRDGRMSFYDLRGYAATLRSEMGEGALAAFREVVLQPTRLDLVDGFFDPESGSGHVWRWAKARSEMRLTQPGSGPRDVTVTFALQSGEPGPFTATLALPDGSTRRVPVTNTATPVSLKLRLAPGEHAIVITTDAETNPPPSDRRDLKLQVLDAGVSEDLLEASAAS